MVVAYNRRDLLEETLKGLLEQTRPVDRIVVVDNASTDGSADMVAAVAPAADLVVVPRNTGGAGGFTIGVARAIAEHGADLVWVMDDDTVPRRGALEGLLDARAALPDAGVYASRVVWTDGRPHPMNTPRTKRLVSRGTRRAAAAADCRPVRSASFVSLLFPAALVARRGLPIADYFLWNDDFEYSARLVRGGIGMSCERSVVEHRTKAFSGIAVDPGERFYLEVRNKAWLLRRSHALSPAEKGFYAAVSAVRWVQVFVRSRDRAVLRSGLRRGLRDGLRTVPRANRVALAGLGAASEAVAAFEDARRG